MFRGAIILGVGFSLGYAKALRDTPLIVVKMDEIINALENAGKSVDADAEGREESDLTDAEQRAQDINSRAN